MQPTSGHTSLLERAVFAFRQGDLAGAERFCQEVVTTTPENFQAWYMLAFLRYQRGQVREALVAVDTALQCDTASADTLNLKGAILRSLGRAEDALASFTAASEIAPRNPEIWLNLSSVQGDLKRPRDALASVEKTLALKPDHIEAWNNRAAALRALKRTDEALESCNRALALKPDYLPALRNKGAILCEGFRVEEGLAVYAGQAELGMSRREEGDELPHKQQHDQEQRAYLSAENIRENFHLDPGFRLPGPAINLSNAGAIAEAWAKNRPQIVVIDNLLTAEALEELRRFCWRSTMWRKPYKEGYLGALPETGFACPLLAQIADELRTVFPTIFEYHPLRYLWGFKYDSALSGIDVHADFAAVNVNFWITSDEANRDPASGGLVVWDVAAPKDWDVIKYNRDANANRAFLEKAGAKPIIIPYRANRAVIFNSDLFHKTDRIDFKPGYLNRRINITILYGDR
jgi:tetratricopeptide (TPR) repeat protein